MKEDMRFQRSVLMIAKADTWQGCGVIHTADREINSEGMDKAYDESGSSHSNAEASYSKSTPLNHPVSGDKSKTQQLRTLLIKNISPTMSREAVETLLLHYGATSIRLMSPYGKMRGCAFVDFDDSEKLSFALGKLHNLVLADRPLRVEETQEAPPEKEEIAEDSENLRSSTNRKKKGKARKRKRRKEIQQVALDGGKASGKALLLVKSHPVKEQVQEDSADLIRAEQPVIQGSVESGQTTESLNSLDHEVRSVICPSTKETAEDDPPDAVPSQADTFSHIVAEPSEMSARASSIQAQMSSAAGLGEPSLGTSIAGESPFALPRAFQTGPPPPAPLCAPLGLHFPPPPHLEYKYPPPDKVILTNIVNALVSVPKFYVQTLHLMNKMNLPAPFERHLNSTVRALGRAKVRYHPGRRTKRMYSDSESEHESSEDGEGIGKGNKMDVSQKSSRPRSQRKRKKAKVGLDGSVDSQPSAKGHQPNIPGSDQATGKTSDAEHEKIKSLPLVTETKVPLARKKSKLKDVSSVLPASLPIFESAKTKQEPSYPGVISMAEVRRQRLSANDLSSLKVAKNYQRGEPSDTLYVKNLAQAVEEEDLYYVFGLPLSMAGKPKSDLAVRLFREGRMRGQAFVTFTSVDLAEKALDMLHGLQLEGKPMILSFKKLSAASAPT